MSKNPRKRSAQSDYDQTTGRRGSFDSGYSDNRSYDSDYRNQDQSNPREYYDDGGNTVGNRSAQNTYNSEAYNDDYRSGNSNEYDRRHQDYNERDYNRSEYQPMRQDKFTPYSSSRQSGNRGSYYGNSLRESFNDRYRPSNHFTEFDTENYRRSDSNRFMDRTNMWGQGNFENEGEFRGKGPKGYKRSDDRIRDDVNDTLTDNGMVDASEVEVTVESGEVTLKGTVNSKRDKRLAEDLAESVSGVSNIENRLRVKQLPQESEEEFSTKSSLGEHGKKRQSSQTLN